MILVRSLWPKVQPYVWPEDAVKVYKKIDIHTGFSKKVPLRIYRISWVIFSKPFLNSKLQPILRSFKKEIIIQ